jgi:Dolichyl-phosphate-mannose-protein mannosyltransferase
MLCRAQAPPPTSRTDDLQAEARRSGSPAPGAPPSNASPLDGTLSGRAPGASASAAAPRLISAPRLRRVAVLERWRAEGMLALLGLALVKLIVGVAFGIGLETKYTILVLGMGFAVGLALTAQRRWLVTPWPWLAALIAAALLAPNLVWQATHGWPTLEFLGNHNAEMAAENPPTRFLSEQLLLIGFALVPLWIAGLVHPLRHPRFRMLGLAAVVVILVLLVQRAKSYYAGLMLPPHRVSPTTIGTQHEDARTSRAPLDRP